MLNLSQIGLPLTVVAVLSLTTLKAQAALLVSSGETGSILRYDEKTGEFLGTFVSPGSGGLKRPTGLTIGPDNNLYVSSVDVNNPANDSILRFNGKTGAFIDVFVASGSGGLEHPSSLTFGPDHNLYVSTLAGKGVLRYNGQNGTFIDTFVSSDGGTLNFPSLTFGPDKNLYVSNSSGHDILRYNGQNGSFLGVFVPASSSMLNVPGGLTFGPDNNLYVGDFSPDGGIRRYNGKTGAFIDTFIPVGSGGLNLPSLGLTFGPDKHFYVTSYGNNSVLRYNGKTGAFKNIFVSAGSGGLNSPEDLIFSPTSDSETYSGLGILGFGACVGACLVHKRRQK
jgi:WD40 repeat protein